MAVNHLDYTGRVVGPLPFAAGREMKNVVEGSSTIVYSGDNLINRAI